MTAIKYMHHVPGRLRVKGHHFLFRCERAREAVAALQALVGALAQRTATRLIGTLL
jgi:hypothetical protein